MMIQVSRPGPATESSKALARLGLGLGIGFSRLGSRVPAVASGLEPSDDLRPGPGMMLGPARGAFARDSQVLFIEGPVVAARLRVTLASRRCSSIADHLPSRSQPATSRLLIRPLPALRPRALVWLRRVGGAEAQGLSENHSLGLRMALPL